MVLVQLFIDIYILIFNDCSAVIFKLFLGSHIFISDIPLIYFKVTHSIQHFRNVVAMHSRDLKICKNDLARCCSCVLNVLSQTLKITALVECYNKPLIKGVWMFQVSTSAMLAKQCSLLTEYYLGHSHTGGQL